MNIILCGLPGSGKTTVGKILADKLQWNFVDTDRLIEEAYAGLTGKQLTCREICSKEGEAFFRNIEKEQIACLIQLRQSVISVGGGSLESKESVAVLQLVGLIFYLELPVSKLWERIVQRGIPSYLDPNEPEKSFYQTADIRVKTFENVAAFIIETDGSSEREVAAGIINIRKKKYGE